MDGMQVDKNGDGKEAGSGRRGGEMFILWLWQTKAAANSKS
jgi:hypothetical protein